MALEGYGDEDKYTMGLAVLQNVAARGRAALPKPAPVVTVQQKQEPPKGILQKPLVLAGIASAAAYFLLFNKKKHGRR
jgi:hypothetical protein